MSWVPDLQSQKSGKSPNLTNSRKNMEVMHTFWYFFILPLKYTLCVNTHLYLLICDRSSYLAPLFRGIYTSTPVLKLQKLSTRTDFHIIYFKDLVCIILSEQISFLIVNSEDIIKLLRNNTLKRIKAF